MPAQVAAGEGVGVSLHFFHGARGEDAAAQFSRAGAEVEQPVGGANDVRIVLYHQDGVAQVTQFFQDADQLGGIPAVQPDGWLVEHVESTYQARAQRSSQLDALRLATRERGRQAVKGDVLESDGVEEM